MICKVSANYKLCSNSAMKIQTVEAAVYKISGIGLPS